MGVWLASPLEVLQSARLLCTHTSPSPIHHHHTHGVALLCGGDCAEEEKERMMRTRLLWFSLGFTSSAAVVSHFVWKDLWVDRHALASHMTHQFDALQARLSHLESSLPNHPPVSDHDQVES